MLYTVESISLSGLLRHWFFSLREVKRLGFTQPVDASAELKYLPHTLTLGHPLLQSDMPIPFPLISDSLHLTLPGLYTFSCSDIQREGNVNHLYWCPSLCPREGILVFSCYDLWKIYLKKTGLLNLPSQSLKIPQNGRWPYPSVTDIATAS